MNLHTPKQGHIGALAAIKWMCHNQQGSFCCALSPTISCTSWTVRNPTAHGCFYVLLLSARLLCYVTFLLVFHDKHKKGKYITIVRVEGKWIISVQLFFHRIGFPENTIIPTTLRSKYKISGSAICKSRHFLVSLHQHCDRFFGCKILSRNISK